MSLRKIIFIVMPLFLLLVGIAYWYLGGFKEAEVSVVDVKGGSYQLVGKSYVGTLKHPGLNELLQEVGQRWEKGELPGVLTVAVLKEPKTDKDTVEQFIGVLLEPATTGKTLPPSYELLEVQAKQAIRVSLEAHASVRPTPDKLREKAEALAKEKGYAIQPNILIEKYHGPNLLVVELPLQEQKRASN